MGMGGGEEADREERESGKHQEMDVINLKLCLNEFLLTQMLLAVYSMSILSFFLANRLPGIVFFFWWWGGWTVISRHALQLVVTRWHFFPNKSEVRGSLGGGASGQATVFQIKMDRVDLLFILSPSPLFSSGPQTQCLEVQLTSLCWWH